MIKKLEILFIVLSFCCFSSNAQLDLYNTQRHKVDQKLMLGLGSWATLNLIGSSIGWYSTTNEEMKSFHQMNFMWNTVNLGLAIPGYIKAKRNKSVLTIAQTIEEQRKTESIFLFNSGLDLAYISGGLILRSEAKSNLEKEDLFNGFGNSLIIQGGFLLVFDWIAYGIHRSRSKKYLSPILNNLELSDSGLGIKYKFNNK